MHSGGMEQWPDVETVKIMPETGLEHYRNC